MNRQIHFLDLANLGQEVAYVAGCCSWGNASEHIRKLPHSSCSLRIFHQPQFPRPRRRNPVHHSEGLVLRFTCRGVRRGQGTRSAPRHRDRQPAPLGRRFGGELHQKSKWQRRSPFRTVSRGRERLKQRKQILKNYRRCKIAKKISNTNARRPGTKTEQP